MDILNKKKIISNINDIELADIKLSTPLFDDNKQYINIYYKKLKKRLCITTPIIINLFKLEIYKKYYQLAIPLYTNYYTFLDNSSNTILINNFINTINTINSYIINQTNVIYNWNINNINIKHPLVYDCIDDPLFNNIPVLFIKFLDDITIIDQYNQKISINDIFPKCYISIVLELNAIWTNNKNISLYLKPILITKYDNLNNNNLNNNNVNNNNDSNSDNNDDNNDNDDIDDNESNSYNDDDNNESNSDNEDDNNESNSDNEDDSNETNEDDNNESNSDNEDDNNESNEDESSSNYSESDDNKNTIDNFDKNEEDVKNIKYNNKVSDISYYSVSKEDKNDISFSDISE